MKQRIMKLQNGSDIRGVAMPGVPGEDVNLDSTTAARIGQAFTNWLCYKVGKNPATINICIGHDSRLSSDEMMEGLKKGICMMGAKVSDAGLASTPAMFMSTVMPYYDFDGAIMVTASHLPFNRNGFKFFTADGGLDKGDIKEILTLAAKCNFIGEWYESEDVNLMDMYAAQLRMQIGSLAGMKIVVDAGNGAGGFFATEVLGRLGADVSDSQFLEPDGNFPNHIPNPENKEAMASICARVKECGADLGLIFDTDVDRSAAVFGSGKEIARNGIVAMAAALIAEDHPGSTVVTDSITSDQLAVFLEDNLGLKHYRFKRGYKNVINKAIELNDAGDNSWLAIETSGHAALRENYFLDDGAYLATKIVIKAANLKKEGKTLDSVLEGLTEPLEAKEVRFPITCEDFAPYADSVLEGFKAWAEKQDDVTIVTPNYEGIRLSFKSEDVQGWILLRMSLHDPVMPMNIEGGRKGDLAKLVEIAKKLTDGFDRLDRSALK